MIKGTEKYLPCEPYDVLEGDQRPLVAVPQGKVSFPEKLYFTYVCAAISLVIIMSNPFYLFFKS